MLALNEADASPRLLSSLALAKTKRQDSTPLNARDKLMPNAFFLTGVWLIYSGFALL